MTRTTEVQIESRNGICNMVGLSAAVNLWAYTKQLT